MKSVETLLEELKQSKKKYIFEVDYYQKQNLINYKIIFADNTNADNNAQYHIDVRW